MKEFRTTDAALIEAHPLAADPRWSLARRIASSETFSKSPRLSAFLLYVSECAVSGREGEINEQQIGIHVFGRAPGYNSNEDSVVRSQARLLRSRLDLYFQEEGRHESLEIRIPKGTYVPKFEPRIPVVTRPEPSIAPVKRWRMRWAVLGTLALLSLAAALVIHSRTATASNDFWKQVFDRHRPTIVVADDTGLVMVQVLTHQQVDLKAYLSRTYLLDSGEMHASVGLHRYTNMTDLNFYSRLSRLPGFDPERTVIRFARDLQVADLKGSNLVIVGARRANPWVELFDRKNNFQGLYSDEHSDYVLNRAPAKGEQAFYNNEHGSEGERSYGVVSFVPGISGDENVLMLGGTNTPGTEGAANFLFSDAFENFLGRTARKHRFEILLRIGTFNGSAQRTEIVSYRLHED